MSDQDELYEKSWILYHILDRIIGSQEIVAIRRMLTVVKDQPDLFMTGSRAEGMDFYWSDVDQMYIDNSMIVLCSYKDINNQIDTANKSVLLMKEANSRPGYVNLELLYLEKTDNSEFLKSIVAVRDAYFISSEIIRRAYLDMTNDKFQSNTEIHGPSVQMKQEYNSRVFEFDSAYSFPCYNWPSEANEWMNRPRLHNWPDKALRDQIVQGSCHLVPVGDKTSADPFLQWRISFATAERKLIYSLSHVQFLVYGLLKTFFKQISGILKQILGEEDVLSSYIIKTVIFHAVENTPGSFWQEQHTFHCFMFCLKSLVSCVNAGFCPNYFIKKNNMFLGKVHGQNRQKLVRCLTDLYAMNWRCLSVGTAIQTTIGEFIHRVRNGVWEYVFPTPAQTERERDLEIFAFCAFRSPAVIPLSLSLKLTSWSKSDIDEFLGYFATVQALSHTGMKIFGEHITARGNKEKYKSLRKSKNLLRPFSTVSKSPGLMNLGTFYYQTGNSMKALELCDNVISALKVFFSWGFPKHYAAKYEKLYCGRGHNLLFKCQAYVSDITLSENVLQFYPSQLHQEIMTLVDAVNIDIPPIPYAMFLSFLCYHDIGDMRRRDRTLNEFRAVKNDERYCKYWIVHNLLGICYEMIGDKHRALREYRNSLGVRTFDEYLNPAKVRIERLQDN